VTSHHNPDGDAIGSIFALSIILRETGKTAIPMVPNDYPEFLKWIPGVDQMMIYEENPVAAAKALISADLIFCLDYNAIHRTGKMQDAIQQSTAPKILIDHHLEPILSDFGLYYSEIETSSTSELLFRLIEKCGWIHLIDQDAATGLYVGIMTDTGSFSYSCDYPETFEITSALSIQESVRATSTAWYMTQILRAGLGFWVLP